LATLVKSKKRDTITGSCPICHFHASKELYVYSYDDKESSIAECCQCGHRWITPIPLEQLHSRHMDSVADGELLHSRILRFLHKWLVVFPEINEVRKIKKNGTLRLLDIACGTGWALSHWQNKNFKVTGLEASEHRSRLCREKYSIDVFTGFIEDFKSEEKFDVVTMRHILEHIENPIAVLEKVRHLLKDDGILLITVPNINSIGRYIFQEKHVWVLPWHLHFYYPKTLTALLRRVGFNERKLYQIPSPLWYPNSFIDLFNENGTFKRILEKLPKILLMILFAPIVMAGWMFGASDNLTIVATKKN
jgi:2-polyprenyl-3-methyl-5-hydroxy-6-metoxy-1,4-benzoquinol methylase